LTGSLSLLLRREEGRLGRLHSSGVDDIVLCIESLMYFLWKRERREKEEEIEKEAEKEKEEEEEVEDTEKANMRM